MEQLLMNILEQIPSDWFDLISNAWSKGELNKWSNDVEKIIKGVEITPKKDRIFKALEDCPVKDVKVLILGQDPYPTAGHANGMAFSTEDFVQPFPKSLSNIFKELKRSIPEYDFPLTGNLTPWAEQGVLLLNTCLTTEVGEANAHKNIIWEKFTSTLIKELFKNNSGLVGMFWGKQAQDFISGIEEKDQLILKSSHPSPLSVYRGFKGCDHFNLCNQYLIQKGENPIEWQT